MGRPLGSLYVIEEQIGRGGMGEVYRAIGPNGVEYAAKVLRPDLADDQSIVTRFVQERSILLGVRHPNLVAVHDLVVERQTLAVVMDLVRGPDLRRALQSVGCVPPAEAARLGAGIAAALAAVHAANVIHRDVKPENVLLDQATSPPTVRLTDFGISRLFGPGHEARTTALMGTPLYLAPEVALGASAGPPTDLYSLGIVLYELCCGVSPFAGGEIATVIHAHTTMDAGRPIGVPDPLWDVIAWMLRKQPEARPQSAAEVVDLLSDLERRLVGYPAAPLIQQPPPRRRTTHPFPMPATDTGVSATVLSPVTPPVQWTPPMPPLGAPLPPPGKPPAGPKRWLVAACIALVVILGSGGVSWALIANGGDDDNQAERVPSPSPISDATPTPTPSETPSPSSTPPLSLGPSGTLVPTPVPTPERTPEPTSESTGALRTVTASASGFMRTYYATVLQDPSYAWTMMTTTGYRAANPLTEFEEYWGSVSSLQATVVSSTASSRAADSYEVVVQLVIEREDGTTDHTTIRHLVVPGGDSYLYAEKLAQCDGVDRPC